ncbi:MAG: phosphate acyltransferase [Chitinispirillia bacterium]|nr:phosphate acyltransferase [Chitinispirillia bacterium]MCL2269047.1 phosphate acyltransferase [Chitinispirillia bacterium]
MIRLAVDVQSGDFGPDAVVRGVVEAYASSSEPFVACLCGDEAQISGVLDGLGGGFDRSNFIIEHCPDIINDDDRRTTVWKNKKRSSIVRCVSLQKEGAADASVSAGDTGILIGSALFILGRAEGVSRPVLAAFIPTPAGPVLIADVGANINCRAEHLAGFADLGCTYVSRLFGKRDVKAALLNIGTEPSKGPEVVRKAAAMLEGDARYAGFIEGSRVFAGDADVVVCDGFIGNVMLKTCESFYALTSEYLSDSPGTFEKLTRKIDALNPENYGAVPFLGINGTVLKAHGGSSVKSIKSAVLTAVKAVVNSAVGAGGDLSGP